MAVQTGVAGFAVEHRHLAHRRAGADHRQPRDFVALADAPRHVDGAAEHQQHPVADFALAHQHLAGTGARAEHARAHGVGPLPA
jgi:hypothetical protein